MQNKNNNDMTTVVWWCVGASLLFFTAGVFALGLGELQVTSSLGEPLKAAVPLIELDRIDPMDVKVRLANAEQYKKNGLAYPTELRLKFKVVSVGDAQPMVKISSVYPIEDPFLTLLIEVSSPIGLLYKTYTFLLDPPPDLLAAPGVVETATSPSRLPQVDTQALPAPLTKEKRVVPAIQSPKRNKPPHTAHPAKVRPLNSAESATREAANLTRTEPPPLFGKLSLTLSTSLTISKNDPSVASGKAGQPIGGDALQEELIAKEKSLNELNLQIAEMQGVIKELQAKLNQTGSPSGVLATITASEVAGSAVPVPALVSVAAPPAVVVTPAVSWGVKITALWAQYRAKILAVLALLGVVGGVYGYRRWQDKQAWNHGPFDDLEEEATQPVEVIPAETAPLVTAMKSPLKVGEKSIKTPAFQVGKDAVPAVPPEYDFLEEADIYLRFGHDKLAEEVLREAIKINPNNPHSYFTLLGIFESRGDPENFAETAQHLKSIGDTTDWHKAMQMGKKLDPMNPLYDEADPSPVDG